MLKTLDGTSFAAGRARFLDEDANALEGTAKIFVKIEPSNLGFPILAQLDTGCAWSILQPEIAEAMELMNEEGQPKKLGTRFGTVRFRLNKLFSDPPLLLESERDNSSDTMLGNPARVSKPIEVTDRGILVCHQGRRKHPSPRCTT